MNFIPANKPDKTAERNCITVIAEGIVILCLALILGGFIGWALMQPAGSW